MWVRGSSPASSTTPSELNAKLSYGPDAGQRQRMLVTEPEELRTRLTVLYGNLLGQESLGRNAERSVYNWAVETANARNIVKRWSNEAFAVLYIGKARTLAWNLTNQGHLTAEVACGRLKARELGGLSHPEMAPDKWKTVIEDKIKRDKRNQEVPMESAATDEFQCYRCRKRRCTYYELQTRSADEPMTTFVHCLECGNHWKC